MKEPHITGSVEDKNMAKTTAKTATAVTVKIMMNDKGAPTGKLADAELHFTEGPLAGLR